MSSIVQKLVRHGFTSQQAQILEEIYPEMAYSNQTFSPLTQSEAILPELLASSAVAVACASTAKDEVLDSFLIPAGKLDTNSILQIEPLWSFTSSANNKLLKIRINRTIVYSVTWTTSVMEAPIIVLANRSSRASQIAPYPTGVYTTAGASSPSTYSIDFSKAALVEFLGQRADGGDTLKLEYYRALHFAGI